MLTTFATLILAFGLGLTALLLFAKLRGVLHYWIRPFRSEEFWALGLTLPKKATPSEIQAVLADANAAVRSLDMRASQVIRVWNHERDELFLGVVLQEKLEDATLQNFDLRHFPAQNVLRLSGQNRADEIEALPAAQEFAKKHDMPADFAAPMMLSGQSFRLYQWNLSAEGESGENCEPNIWAKTLEWLAQVRDNLSLPILLTIIAIGLLGMRDPLLFAIGIGFIVLLSGACKFVLIHQNRDEADELHLQNY